MRPDQFAVDPKEPFERDRLDRRGRVEALCGLIERTESAAVIAVNGPFGSGKSAFVRMCAAHLRNRDVTVAEFNAWQQSHTRWPLIDLVSALGSDATLAERLRGIAVNLAWRAANVASRGLIARDDLSEPKNAAQFEEWKQIENGRAKFREALAEEVAEANDKLVVVIDELDRCVPRYALDMLDVVRHLFDVPGVVVLLGVNQDELCQRVKSLFGPECTADVYLRRFIDLTIDLPNPDPQQLVRFLDETFGGAGLEERLRSSDYSAWFVGLLAERTGASLRDIEQIVHELSQVLALAPTPSHGQPQSAPTRDQTIVALFALRVADPTTYAQLRTGGINALEAAASLGRALRLTAPEAARHHPMVRMLTAIVALDHGDGRFEFDQNAIESAFGDAGIAEAISEHLRAFDDYLTRFGRDATFDIVDLAVAATAQRQ